MKRTNLYLDERQTAALDAIALAEQISRAEVVRQLIDRALDLGEEGLADDLAALDASFGVLVDEEWDSARTRDGRMEYLERLVTQ